MLNKLRQFLGLENLQEKLERYESISKSFEQVDEQLNQLAKTFYIEKCYFHDRMNDPDNFTIQNKIKEKFDKFLTSHKEDIRKSKKEYDKLKKEKENIEKDERIEKALKEIRKSEAYGRIKKSYQDGKISLESFNTVIKGLTKEDKTKYADFILFNEKGQILILKRSQWEDNHKGAWVIPGGHVDPGEDFETAAIRELREESGFNVDRCTNVGSYQDENAHIEYFQATINTSEQSPILDVFEARDLQWIDLCEVHDYEFIFNMKENLIRILGIEESNQKKILKSEVVDLILKGQHKYIRKELDGHGGWNYVYEEEKVSTSKEEPLPKELSDKLDEVKSKLTGYLEDTEIGDRCKGVLDLLNENNIKEAINKFRGTRLHYEIGNTYQALRDISDEIIIHQNFGLDWGTKPGRYEVWRSGEIGDQKNGIFFSIDKEGAESYSHGKRETNKYSVEIKNPLVVNRVEEAYSKLSGISISNIIKQRDRYMDVGDWWVKLDEKVAKLAKQKGYDSITYIKPAPPAIRELVLLNKDSIVKSLDFDLQKSMLNGLYINLYQQIEKQSNKANFLVEKGFNDEANLLLDEIEKAKKDISKLNKIKKLVYKNGKVFMQTYYVKTGETVEEEVSEKIGAITEDLNLGDSIEIEKSLIRNDIEKSWVKQQIGTVVTHKDGQKYRKVSETGNPAKDWQLVTKDKTGSNQDTQTSEHKYKPAELAKHAKSTSEENLQAAIKQSEDPKLREAAHKEIVRREKEEKVQEDKVDGGKEIDVESLKKKYKEAFEKDDFDTLQKIAKQLAENAKKVHNQGNIDQSKYTDKRFTQNFTEEERDNLDIYASIKYREINSQMRDGNLSKENQKIVDSILQSMNKNKLKEDVIVYRGVGGHYDKSNKNSFTSTSTDKETAKNFARGQNAEVREIKVPKGTPVAYMGGAERELILPPNWDKQELKKSEDNELKGGKGDRETIQSLAKKHKVSEDQIKEQIKMGLKVEMEHTTNPKVALEIVMDHLTESCEYYTKLKQMESTLKKEKE